MLRARVWCAVCANCVSARVWCVVCCVCELCLRGLLFNGHVTKPETIQSEHIRKPEKENCG